MEQMNIIIGTQVKLLSPEWKKYAESFELTGGETFKVSDIRILKEQKIIQFSLLPWIDGVFSNNPLLIIVKAGEDLTRKLKITNTLN